MGLLAATTRAEPIADGVWLVRGGMPKTMNVYMIEGDRGVTLFDAGVTTMTRSLRRAAGPFGGIERVVLGHSHPDHRGAAPELGGPVLCHPDERPLAEVDGYPNYFDLSKLDTAFKAVMPRLLKHWDGGPVKIADTIREGEEIAGFEVIHLPGHAPGQIGLWRETDRLALVSDAFYTLDPQTGIKGAPRPPRAAFNWDEDLLRSSLLKLAALGPSTVWTGHADPIQGDVRNQLEEVARQAPR